MRKEVFKHVCEVRIRLKHYSASLVIMSGIENKDSVCKFA
jgi:hypothetical protein